MWQVESLPLESLCICDTIFENDSLLFKIHLYFLLCKTSFQLFCIISTGLFLIDVSISRID